MRAYFNEIDPYCAEWLYNLQRANLIAPGDIDTRPIQDVRPSDLRGYTQCHFFAGLGGWSYALRRAGWRDDRPVWTGSCPCQPFSAAGRRRGFADDRHLWPFWRYLVAVERPAVVFGEQVASAADWLRLVRGDMEALGYAVGAMPVEAASAGADHLRDRYWFVADADFARSQGRALLPERPGEWTGWPDGVADADQLGAREGRQQRGGEFGWAGSDPQTRAGDVGYTIGARAGRDGGSRAGAETQGGGKRRTDGRSGDAPISSGAALEWAIGADGKARRVKSGIRLLAHGVPSRVAKLRALGNAIDWRPAARFIEAYMTSL